jgi:hypothetical protein
MNLLKRVEKYDALETVIVTYKCHKMRELRQFIKNNIEDIYTLNVDFREGDIYIIQILDCITITDIKIKKVE